MLDHMYVKMVSPIYESILKQLSAAARKKAKQIKIKKKNCLVNTNTIYTIQMIYGCRLR